MMVSLGYLTIFSATIQLVSSLRCYGFVRSTDSSSPTVGLQDSLYIPNACMNQTCLCISFVFQCINNNTLCTTKQLHHESTVWTYALTGVGTCQQLIQSSIIKNLTCCYTDLCNNQSVNAPLTTTRSVAIMSLNNNTSSLFRSILLLLLLGLCVI
ncbi:unnamed protein product [Adineta ricciae]|uniref:Uncharacterized protein n=1 Tax=Adineta ricciae TaxID=249248 RepID=A0A814VIQ1_ADIRI|nr:unnamed protein product [Adineta ricciae]CAF1191342.1 unnamed protein product [Adineta ricciae]